MKDVIKLEKKGSYADLRSLLFDFFSKKEALEDWKEGTRIHLGNPNFLCLKKRMGGSGGYRMYYLLTIHGDEITIAALYPKFGTKGGSDLSDSGKIESIGEAIDSIVNKTRWKIITLSDKKSIIFEPEEKNTSKTFKK